MELQKPWLQSGADPRGGGAHTFLFRVLEIRVLCYSLILIKGIFLYHICLQTVIIVEVY